MLKDMYRKPMFPHYIMTSDKNINILFLIFKIYFKINNILFCDIYIEIC